MHNFLYICVSISVSHEVQFPTTACVDFIRL